ncbi:MAG: DUF4870 domain-containing protein [Candidatus Gracilibacteria bacterium]|jgi:uncharacterized membrane protein
MAEENKKQETAPQTTPPSPQPEKVQQEEKPKISQEERFLSAVAYLSIGFLIPLILKPDSKTCQFHAKQGAGMFVLCIIVLFILLIMPMIGTLLFLGFFGLSVLSIYKAYTGEEWRIPVLSEFAGKVDLNKLMMTTPAKEQPKAQETPPATTPKQ